MHLHRDIHTVCTYISLNGCHRYIDCMCMCMSKCRLYYCDSVLSATSALEPPRVDQCRKTNKICFNIVIFCSLRAPHSSDPPSAQSGHTPPPWGERLTRCSRRQPTQGTACRLPCHHLPCSNCICLFVCCCFTP